MEERIISYCRSLKVYLTFHIRKHIMWPIPAVLFQAHVFASASILFQDYAITDLPNRFTIELAKTIPFYLTFSLWDTLLVLLLCLCSFIIIVRCLLVSQAVVCMFPSDGKSLFMQNSTKGQLILLTNRSFWISHRNAEVHFWMLP